MPTWIRRLLEASTTPDDGGSPRVQPGRLAARVEESVLRRVAHRLDRDLSMTGRALDKTIFSLRVVAFNMYRLWVLECVSGIEARVRYSRRNQFYSDHRKQFGDLVISPIPDGLLRPEGSCCIATNGVARVAPE